MTKVNNEIRHTFTKSDYIQYLKCPKELWLRKNKKELFEKEDTPEKKFLIDQGYLVQEYAEKLITDMHSGKFESEAKAVYENLYTRADILVSTAKGNVFDIYEVKSSSGIKEHYYSDLAFQKYVFEKSGKKIRNLFLVFINNQYIRKGEIDVKQLFKIEKVTDLVNKLLPSTEKKIAEAIEYIEGDCPEITISDDCEDHLKCPFTQHFLPDLPEYTVFDISRINKGKLDDLLCLNMVDIKSVPDDFPLSPKQRLQVQLAKSEEIIIRKSAIKKELSKLKYPLYFIDYESLNYAIPLFDNIRPFQQMVFQYSLFIQKSPKSKIIHKEFLADGTKEPSGELAKALSHDINIPGGTFIVWNKTFEMSRNKEMAALYPDYKDVMKQFNDNVFDLMTIFSNQYYVHPHFKGKTSLKKVLPVLYKKNCYSDLTINQGQLASVMWFNMIKNIMPRTKKNTLKINLLKYCEMDTYGMVEILNVLKKCTAKQKQHSVI
jgi:CRISPR/Cas system-associated exonuclease Cas4 (RecB family)